MEIKNARLLWQEILDDWFSSKPKPQTATGRKKMGKKMRQYYKMTRTKKELRRMKKQIRKSLTRKNEI